MPDEATSVEPSQARAVLPVRAPVCHIRGAAMEPLTDADWGNFFDLIDRIASMEGKTWKEKMALVEEKAKSYDSEFSLAEFCSWDWTGEY
jgi:hypothetical protein